MNKQEQKVVVPKNLKINSKNQRRIYFEFITEYIVLLK